MKNSGMMDDHERRAETLKEARKKLEDAILVMTHLEAKYDSNVKSQDKSTDE